MGLGLRSANVLWSAEIVMETFNLFLKENGIKEKFYDGFENNYKPIKIVRKPGMKEFFQDCHLRYMTKEECKMLFPENIEFEKTNVLENL